MTHDSHNARKLGLAEWYAREAIANGSIGMGEAEADHIETAREYLEAVTGKRLDIDTADEVIAHVCTLREQAATT